MTMGAWCDADTLPADSSSLRSIGLPGPRQSSRCRGSGRRATTTIRAATQRVWGLSAPAHPSGTVHGCSSTGREFAWGLWRHRDVPPEPADRLPLRIQLCHSRVAFFGVLLLVADPQPPGLGAGAGPGDVPAEGQGCLGRIAQPLGDHGCPQRQHRRTVYLNAGCVLGSV